MGGVGRGWSGVGQVGGREGGHTASLWVLATSGMSAESMGRRRHSVRGVGGCLGVGCGVLGGCVGWVRGWKGGNVVWRDVGGRDGRGGCCVCV